MAEPEPYTDEDGIFHSTTRGDYICRECGRLMPKGTPFMKPKDRSIRDGVQHDGVCPDEGEVLMNRDQRRARFGGDTDA